MLASSAAGERRMAATAAAASPAPAPGMTDSEKFFFDLNGFLVVRGVLSAEEVAAANAAVDAHAGERFERTGSIRNTRNGSPLSGDGKTGRVEMGNMLGWPEPHRAIFRKLLAHPRLLPYLVAFCGEGYRMDHLPLLLMNRNGSEGFHLHGGPLTSTGGFNPTLQYRCVNGEFFNSLIGMAVQIAGQNEGDGGFCVVRGSHKINFPLPKDFIHGESEEYKAHIHQPVTRAGDVVFFSEATVHGALPWCGEHERRIALYRFSPATLAYGRSYSPSWPAEMLDGLTPAQQAVLEPPYANRLDRPVLKPEEEQPVVETRNQAKKDFDAQIFRNKYF